MTAPKDGVVILGGGICGIATAYAGAFVAFEGRMGGIAAAAATIRSAPPRPSPNHWTVRIC